MIVLSHSPSRLCSPNLLSLRSQVQSTRRPTRQVSDNRLQSILHSFGNMLLEVDERMPSALHTAISTGLRTGELSMNGSELLSRRPKTRLQIFKGNLHR